MKKIRLIINNDHKKEKEKFFIKKELQCILNLYAKMVSNGTWKDYSLSADAREISFDVYQRASDQPVLRILKKYKNWSAYVVGDEPRDKLDFKHKRLKNFGFKEHHEVIKIYRETSIAVVCSRWDEPFGRTSLEAAANGCAVIISNRASVIFTKHYTKTQYAHLYVISIYLV